MASTYYHCKCLDRRFMRKEWHEYVNQHPNCHDEPVFKFKGYEYNIFDVCLNPHIPVNVVQGEYSVVIRTAEQPSGTWGLGMACNLHTACRWYGVLYDYSRDRARTEREAVYEGLRECESMILEEIERLKDSKSEAADIKQHQSTSRSFLKKVQHYIDIYDPDQLTLFEDK